MIAPRTPASPVTECTHAQVLISGAGPVGLLLANLLGLANIRTLIMDKRVVPLENSMAIGVTPPSLEILQRLDLDQAFINAGVPVRYAEVHESGSKLGRLDFHRIPSNYPFFLSIPQARTVEILRHNLARFSSVTIQDGRECTGVEQNPGGVRVSVREVGTGSVSQARGDILVGCDGHRSTVRAVAGLCARERLYPQRFVMADFVDESRLGFEARLFFSPEASVESFPLPGGLRRWIVLASQARVETPLQYLIRAVHRLAGFDLDERGVRFVSTFGARRMTVDRYHAGRVALAGDAAHVMSSIGGQGMNTGFADVELLAAQLPGVLRNPALLPRAFSAYERIRRRAFAVAADRAERGMWLGTLRGRLASGFRKHFIRDVLFSLPLRSRLAPHFAMLTIPFRNLNHVPSENLF